MSVVRACVSLCVCNDRKKRVDKQKKRSKSVGKEREEEKVSLRSCLCFEKQTNQPVHVTHSFARDKDDATAVFHPCFLCRVGLMAVLSPLSQPFAITSITALWKRRWLADKQAGRVWLCFFFCRTEREVSLLQFFFLTEKYQTCRKLRHLQQ